MAKLSAKQKRFCVEYLIDTNATQAALRAGYSKQYANKKSYILLEKKEIKEYIDAELAKVESEKVADVKEVMEYLTSVMRNKVTEDAVVVEGCGDGCSEARIIQKDTSIKERNKAAELLGKRYGIFTDKVDTNVNVNSTAKLDSILNELGDTNE